MGKYDRFGAYLRAQYNSEIPMTFGEIEAILGTPLPPSARRYRPWWSNNVDNSAMTRAWVEAGFRTQQVDMAHERVVFVRAVRRSAAAPVGFDDATHSAADTPAKHPAIGALKGLIVVPPGIDLTEPADPDWDDRLPNTGATASGLVGLKQHRP